ncbi:MAG: hypothetical protein KAT68_18470 [Bacteroidales bacterium]|nr:hypothetical protein [Bacteroidales bacterium]
MMNDFLIILLGVPIGIATSFIVLLIIYKKSRPEIHIANEISHSKHDSYYIKIINKTKFEIINIRVKLFRVKVSNIPNGTIRTHYELPLEKQEWFSLSKF